MDTTLPPFQLNADAFEQAVKYAVQKEMENTGLGEDALESFKRAKSREQKLQKAVQVWKNAGYLRYSDRFTKFSTNKDAWDNRMTYERLVDVMSTPDATILIPKVVSQIVREAVEPQLSLTGLFRRIDFSAGSSITFPAVSAMKGVKEIGEGQEYPELAGPRFAGTVTVKMGKSAGAVRVTEEMLRYSQWDVMSMLFQGAGRAFGRHKEQRIFNQISDNAVLSFSNSSPSSADNGRTTGRDLNGQQNNTLRLDDLFVVYADLVNDGFIPNTLIMNPLGWLIFARDPSMRAFAFANGGPLMRTVSGAGGTDPSWMPNLGTRSTATQLSYSSQHYVDVPQLFPVPLSIVVSPFVTHSTANSTTDMFMADREELGLMVVDEDLVTDNWQDPMKDIHYVKMRERYGLCILNEGAGVRKLQAISTNRGYDFEDSKTVWNVDTNALPT